MMIFKKQPYQFFGATLFYLSYAFVASAQPENSSIPLFQAYPQLKEKVGYAKLGALPTPIQKLEKLGSALNSPNLYIKKDNESGTLFGGNKIRKLEFLFGDAITYQAKGVLTMGCAG